MEYYKINVRTGLKAKVYFVESNMFQKDIVKRLFPSSSDTVLNGEYINPSCLRFTVFPAKWTSKASIVYITRLYSEDIEKIKACGEVVRWKRIYKI